MVFVLEVLHLFYIVLINVQMWNAIFCKGTVQSKIFARGLHWLWLDDCHVNTLRPRQGGRHIPEDIFKYIFFNENVQISIKISLKFVLKGPTNNIPALVQIIAWRRQGDEPLSGPVMVSLLTHVWVTRPQWVNGFSSGLLHWHWGNLLSYENSTYWIMNNDFFNHNIYGITCVDVSKC